MRIAFAGNPNSGKTTMYNALTGKNERVGNWAGVTIGRKESPIKADYANTTEELVAVDLPGAYSTIHTGRKYHQRIRQRRTSGCDHQYRRCNKPESKPVFHDTASGTGDPGSGGTQQE